MAKQYFRVVEDSYINNTLIKGDGKTIVHIETDPKLKGMIPKSNLVRVNEDGSDYVPEVRAAHLISKAQTAGEAQQRAGQPSGTLTGGDQSPVANQANATPAHAPGSADDLA